MDCPGPETHFCRWEHVSVVADYVRPGRGLPTGYLPRLLRITATTTAMSATSPSAPGTA